MAAAKRTTKKTSRGRKQDRARVAGGQDYEVRYEAKKTGRSKAAVKKAVKKVSNSRKKSDGWPVEGASAPHVRFHELQHRIRHLAELEVTSPQFVGDLCRH